MKIFTKTLAIALIGSLPFTAFAQTFPGEPDNTASANCTPPPWLVELANNPSPQEMSPQQAKRVISFLDKCPQYKSSQSSDGIFDPIKKVISGGTNGLKHFEECAACGTKAEANCATLFQASTKLYSQCMSKVHNQCKSACN